ncbi:MAG: polymorphic toxin type 47 domain-containing protein, partial [Bacteroidota bacterium]
GNRIRKGYIDEDGTEVTDYYVRDASGNTMAIYKQVKEVDSSEPELTLKEISLYGSDRLGLYRPDMKLIGGEGLVPEEVKSDELLVTTERDIYEYQGKDIVLSNNAKVVIGPDFNYEANVSDVDGFRVRMQQYEVLDEIPNLYSRRIDQKNYEMKDHLGNVRAVISDLKLADVSSGTPTGFKANLLEQIDYYPFGMTMPNLRKPEVDMSLATLETENATEEQATFGSSYYSGSIVPAEIYNYTQTYQADKSQRLTGLEGEIVGLARSLQVKSGDTVSIEVYAKYLMQVPDADATNVALLLAPALTESLLTSGVDVTSEIQQTFEELFASGPIISVGDETTPRAYLNYLLFDENLVLVDAGYQRVSALAIEDGSDIFHEKLELEVVPDQKGTMYVYLSNESVKMTEVFFDDFRIEHATSSIIGNEVAYRYGFNGKERDKSFGLTNYDYGFRIYNPAIGKFLSVDPLTAKYPWYTPYQFAGNMPIRYVDIDGLEAGLLDVYDFTPAIWFNKWRSDRHHAGLRMLDMNERADPDADFIDKTLAYIGGFWLDIEEFTPAESASVITQGVTLQNERAGVLDYAFAGGEIVVTLFGGQIYKAVVKAAKKTKKPLKYTLTVGRDVDLRGTDATFDEALNLAFEATGIPKEQFKINKWGKTVDGKDFPTEWIADGPDGHTVEVNVDFAHFDSNYGKNGNFEWESGPDAPHVGYQWGKKKTKVVGHILLDDVPAGRTVDKEDLSVY